MPKIRRSIRAISQRATPKGFHSRLDDRSVAGSEEDLIQCVIVRLIDKECALLKRFSGNTEDEFSAYLAVIARSVVLDAARHDICYKRHLRMLGDSTDRLVIASAEDVLMIREGLELAEKAVEAKSARLSIRNRLILRLHFLHGLPAAQISRIRAFGLSKDGVQNVLLRARKGGRSMVRAPCAPAAVGRIR
ncbi:MAG: sigma-70 family RNA polymerase sigma factor [Nitrospira sp.]|nr:sigma-70 family RNA polymerase sigma factor [Nitrospira sp.]